MANRAFEVFVDWRSKLIAGFVLLGICAATAMTVPASKPESPDCKYHQGDFGGDFAPTDFDTTRMKCHLPGLWERISIELGL